MNASEDDLVPLVLVAQELKRSNGKPLHRSTVYRWATRGIGGHRLRVVALGDQLRTTRAWLRQFGREVAASRGYATEGIAS